MEFWRYLHLLAMAFFVGGQIFLVAAVVPVFRGDENREPIRAVARRFGTGSLIALGILLISGSAMASEDDKWSSPTLHVKLALVALAAILVLVHTRKPQQHAYEGAIFVVSLVIVGLGIALAH
jgi:uncharacterized membrane protein